MTGTQPKPGPVRRARRVWCSWRARAGFAFPLASAAPRADPGLPCAGESRAAAGGELHAARRARGHREASPSNFPDSAPRPHPPPAGAPERRLRARYRADTRHARQQEETKRQVSCVALLWTVGKRSSPYDDPITLRDRHACRGVPRGAARRADRRRRERSSARPTHAARRAPAHRQGAGQRSGASRRHGLPPPLRARARAEPGSWSATSARRTTRASAAPRSAKRRSNPARR